MNFGKLPATVKALAVISLIQMISAAIGMLAPLFTTTVVARINGLANESTIVWGLMSSPSS